MTFVQKGDYQVLDIRPLLRPGLPSVQGAKAFGNVAAREEAFGCDRAKAGGEFARIGADAHQHFVAAVAFDRRIV